jgi:AcrR family transcriptional regulator
MMSSGQQQSSPTTRAAIVGAGQKLLLSNKPFSMGNVADLAGVSRQAVYLHFKHRYALLEAIVDEVIAATSIDESRTRIANAKTGREALGHFVEAMVRVSQSHGALDQAVRAILANDPKLAKRWAGRSGRSARVRAIVDRLMLDGAVSRGVSAAQCGEVIEAFTSTHVLVRLLGSMSADDLNGLLNRSISAAVLRPG